MFILKFIENQCYVLVAHQYIFFLQKTIRFCISIFSFKKLHLMFDKLIPFLLNHYNNVKQKSSFFCCFAILRSTTTGRFIPGGTKVLNPLILHYENRLTAIVGSQSTCL